MAGWWQLVRMHPAAKESLPAPANFSNWQATGVLGTGHVADDELTGDSGTIHAHRQQHVPG